MKTITEAQNRAMFLLVQANKSKRSPSFTAMGIEQKKTNIGRGLEEGKIYAYLTILWDLVGNTFNDTYWQNIAMNLEVEQIKTGLPLMEIVENRDNWKPVTIEDAVKYIQGK